MAAVAFTKKRGPMDLVLISFFSFLVISIPAGLLNIAWTYMQGTFGVSLDALGTLLSASVAAGLLMSFASGRIIGRIGAGNTLLLAACLHLVGMSLYIIVPTWEMLLGAAFISGLGTGLIDVGMNTVAAAKFSTGQLNWLHAFFGLGQTIGPIVVTYVVVSLQQPWQLSYGVVLVLDVMFVAIMFLTRKRWQIKEQLADGEEEIPDAPGLATLRLPIVLIVMVFFFVYAGMEVGGGQLANTLFLEGWGVEQSLASLWVSSYWGLFTVGRILIGLFADRFPNNLIMRVCMAGVVLGAALLWLHPSDELGAIGLAILGFSQAPVFAILISDTPKRVGAAHVANAIGFQVGFAGLGIAVLPGIGGVIAARYGADTIGPYLFVLVILLVIIHEVVILHDRRTLEKAKR